MLKLFAVVMTISSLLVGGKGIYDDISEPPLPPCWDACPGSHIPPCPNTPCTCYNGGEGFTTVCSVCYSCY